MRPKAVLAEIGARLSSAREARNLSVTEVAQRSGISARYLRMAESGEANVSILKLVALSRVLRAPLRELCDLDISGAPDLRIALLGVRGAGKSTVGRAVAQQLETPFVELDALIEELAGMPLDQLFSIHGERYYRSLQGEALESFLAQHGAGVLATGGSIVSDRTTFARLCATCRTVWLRARPETHWERVVAQGDLRPMRHNPRAMLELEALLEARTPYYASADLTVDTDSEDPEAIAARIAHWAES